MSISMLPPETHHISSIGGVRCEKEWEKGCECE